MNNAEDIQWKRRLAIFGTSLKRLNEACAQDSYSHLERSGLIKTFEFCFELSWKVLKDLLSYEGTIEKSPRMVIRKSFELGYIDEEVCKNLLEALEWRNVLSHVYQEDVALEAERLIKQHYHTVLVQIHSMLCERANQ